MVSSNPTSSTSLMKFICATAIIIISLVGFSNGQDGNPAMHSSFMSRAANNNPLNSSCQPNSDRYCYFREALQYIFSREPPTIIIPDDETLRGLIYYALFFMDDQLSKPNASKPGDYDFLKEDLFRLALLLDQNGSSAITYYDIKYYIKRFVTPTNIAGLVGLYYRDAPQNAKRYLNEVFLGGIPNEGCQKALSLWFDAMGQPQANLWALRMFDATGKPPTNLLAANTNWLGNWNSCHKVKYSTNTSNFAFKGRYCRAKVRANPLLLAALPDSVTEGFPGNPDELAAIDLGMCVPDFCGEEDIGVLVNNTLKLMTIHQFGYVREVDGISCEGPAKPGGVYYFTIVLITILTVIVVLATLYDCFYRTILNKPFATASTLSMQNLHTICNFSSTVGQPQGIFYKNLEAYQYQYSNRLQLHGMAYPSEVERAAVQKSRKNWYNQFIFRIHRIVIDLSAYTAILKPMSSTGAMKCLNGIRVLSMVWIIWGHTYNYIGDQSYFLLTQNALDLLDLQKQRIDPQLIINALYGVDTFFLVSATLISLSLLRMLSKNGMPKFYFWPLMYLERYLRLVPPYIMIFLLYIFVVPYIGSGPLWKASDFPMKNADCHDYWWAYFLLVNNFVPNGKGTRCLGYYWYVSNDFQLFLIAPFLIVPLFYSLPIGLGILIGCLVASSCILGFNIANTYRTGQILVTLQAIWEDTYIKPYCRAGPYVIGILLGYIFFRTDKKKVHLHPLIQIAAWLLTIGFMLISVLLNWQNHGEGLTPMTPGAYTAYFVLSRIAWPLAIAWIIFACYKGLAPLIDNMLSWRGFTFFANMSYTTYLIHPMIMVYYMFAQQNLFHATDITLIYIFIGHLMISLIMGFLTHVIFERTFGVLIGLLLPKRQR